MTRTLARAGLSRPHAARVPVGAGRSHDRATELLETALRQCGEELDRDRPGWRRERVGLIVGTSSGGMLSAERFFHALADGAPLSADLARKATYFAPLQAACERLGIEPEPRAQILGACASSTLALGLALRWLELGRCDLVLAGGYDGVSLFVAAGFEALLATSASRPRPFRLGRDGMALGEGAAILALAPGQADGHAGAARTRGFILGFGSATDAIHVTAPDRTGAALAHAGAMALADAGASPSGIDLVSAHATATPFNDPAEAKALARIFGPDRAARASLQGADWPYARRGGCFGVARGARCHGAGHRACGRWRRGHRSRLCGADADARQESARPMRAEALVGIWRRERRVGARCSASSRVLFAHPARSTFGTTSPSPSGSRSSSCSRRESSTRTSGGSMRSGDSFFLRSESSSARSASQGLEGAGLVVGHGLATLETNALFDARKRERGARHVEPRRFPATSPNVSVGECAIAFHLHGPSFAVGASLQGGLEALEIARDLVAAGDAERMVVVGVDQDGPVSRELLRRAGWAPIAEGACAALLSADSGPVGRPGEPSRGFRERGLPIPLAALQPLPTWSPG